MSFIELDPRFFSDTELTFEERERKPRIIMANDGRDKSGKSDFCYDAPDPIAVLSFDFGDEDVVQKYQELGRKIHIADLKWELPAHLHSVKGEGLAEWMNKNVWQPFVYTTNKIIDSGMFRTVVVDKATEAWQVCRLAVFGRLATNRQDLQTQANANWREYVRKFNACEKPINLHLIHEQREEWVSKSVQGKDGPEEKWYKSGAWVRDGNEKVPFLVPYTLEHRYVKSERHPVLNDRIIKPARFEVEVMVARGRPEQVGTIHRVGELDVEKGALERRMGWLDVVSSLRPEIPLEAWGHANLR